MAGPVRSRKTGARSLLARFPALRPQAIRSRLSGLGRVLGDGPDGGAGADRREGGSAAGALGSVRHGVLALWLLSGLALARLALTAVHRSDLVGTYVHARGAGRPFAVVAPGAPAYLPVALVCAAVTVLPAMVAATAIAWRRRWGVRLGMAGCVPAVLAACTVFVAPYQPVFQVLAVLSAAAAVAAAVLLGRPDLRRWSGVV
jgi:hypothetical protein